MHEHFEMYARAAGRRRALALLVALLVALSALLAAAPKAEAARDYSTVRIKLSNANDGTLNLSLAGVYRLKETGKSISGDILLTNTGNKMKITRKKDNALIYTGKSIHIIRAADQKGKSGTIRMFNAANGLCNYLGDLSVSAEGSKGFYVINTLPMEHYLYGVVAHEMNDSWPLETLKAQAVAARGYAAGRLTTKRSYDLLDTPQDQVYKGYNSAYKNVKKAVDSTKGEVLYHGNTIILPYYGASNGGQTDLTANIWNNATGYTQMKDDPYDVRNINSPKQTIFFPSKVSESTPIKPQLESYLKKLVAPSLKKQGYATQSNQMAILGISNLKGSKRKYPSPSRNYTHATATVKVRAMKGSGTLADTAINYPDFEPEKPIFTQTDETANGPIYSDQNGNLYDNAEKEEALEEYEKNFAAWKESMEAPEDAGGRFDGEGDTVDVDVEFRIYDLKEKSMGYRLFTNDYLIMYTVEKTEGGANLVNVRFGHGVGMSQRGAQQMGKEGLDYKFILNFYYKDVELKKLNYKTTILAEETVPENPLANGLEEEEGTAVPEEDEDGIVIEAMNFVGAAGLPPAQYGGFSVLGALVAEGSAIGTIKGTTVNLRKEANTASSVIELLAGGSMVTILGQSGDFYKVRSASGKEGFVSSALVAVSEGRVGVIKSDNVNLRSSANTTASVVAKLKKDQRVSVEGSEGPFYKVKTAGGAVGYVSDQYIVVQKGGASIANISNAASSNANTPPPSKSQGGTSGKSGRIIATGIISGDTVNLRKGPSSTSQVLSSIPKGSKVGIIATNSGYYKVSYQGTIGYVRATYIPKNTIKAGDSTSAGGAASPSQAGNTQTASGSQQGTVTADGLNLRSQSGTVIGKLYKGDSVTILGSSGSKYKVSTGRFTGYVESKFIRTTGGGTPVAKTGTNIRATASTSAPKIGMIYQNEPVEILETEGEWLKIKAKGMTGYVMAKYIEQ